jgi:6-phosphogluconolactonase (cycloisomerase 2 family)
LRNQPPSTRRDLLKAGLALAAPLRAASAAYAYVGCYTTAERHGRGDGIHAYRMDPETGAWTHIQRVGDLINPSFVIVSHDRRFLYSAHGDETYATSFAIDPATGMLKRLNQAATGGTNGAHLALHRSRRFLAVANYATGSVAMRPVRPDGTLADHTQLVSLPGEPGPHKTEQIGSHPHQVVFDPSGRYLMVPDKGLDRVFVFRFDETSGRLTPTRQGSVQARPGAGPRHGAFHPTLPVAWVANEMHSTVTTFAWNEQDGSLKPIQIAPSLPEDYTGNNSCAEIAVSKNGLQVYVSNRGHDSVAIFAADARKGTLKPLGWQSTQGRTPRFIGLDPSNRFLYATNEQSDTVVTFRVDQAKGRLTPTGQVIRNASPVTIAFSSVG